MRDRGFLARYDVFGHTTLLFITQYAIVNLLLAGHFTWRGLVARSLDRGLHFDGFSRRTHQRNFGVRGCRCRIGWHLLPKEDADGKQDNDPEKAAQKQKRAFAGCGFPIQPSNALGGKICLIIRRRLVAARDGGQSQGRPHGLGARLGIGAAGLKVAFLEILLQVTVEGPNGSVFINSRAQRRARGDWGGGAAKPFQPWLGAGTGGRGCQRGRRCALGRQAGGSGRRNGGALGTVDLFGKAETRLSRCSGNWSRCRCCRHGRGRGRRHGRRRGRRRGCSMVRLRRRGNPGGCWDLGFLNAGGGALAGQRQALFGHPLCGFTLQAQTLGQAFRSGRTRRRGHSPCLGAATERRGTGGLERGCGCETGWSAGALCHGRSGRQRRARGHAGGFWSQPSCGFAGIAFGLVLGNPQAITPRAFAAGC